MAVLMALCVLPAQAQFRTSVQGTVTDPTGAVIPGATLSLKDNATNQTVVRTSDGTGIFNFGALAPDQFTLTVTATGFETKVMNNLRFIPEQANSLNVQLTIGGATSTVTVEANNVPQLDTQTSNVGATITANDIQHMPTFNRDVFTLSQLAPGTVSDGAQNAGGGVSTNPGNQGPGGSGNGGAPPTENGPQVNANGQQYQNNSISLDGISTVSAVWGGTSVITPSAESVDNVRVVSNAYDAEDGRFAGAQTLVTSKAGSNDVHGSAFFSAHRPGLNAYQRTLHFSDGSAANSPVRDSQQYNQFGGSVGGPFWKNKLFGFFAFESSPNNSNSTGTGWYETDSFRSSAAAGPIASQFLGFTGAEPIGTLVTTTANSCRAAGLIEGVNCSTVAGQGLDIGSPITTGVGTQDLTTDGTTNQPGIGGGLDNVADVALYSTSTPYSSFYHQYNGRLDANLTEKDHVAFAIYWVPQGNTSYNGGARGYNLFHHTQTNDAFSLIWNHTFSPTFLNEARANAAGWRWNEIADNATQPVGLPQASISVFSAGATINDYGTALGSIANQWTFTYKDVATKIAGRHTLKFGGELTALHELYYPLGRPSYGFYDIWDFLNDAPYQESGNFNPTTGTPGGFRSDQREYLFGAFAQDNFKLRPNLTVQAGIRYSYFGSLYSKQDNLPHVVFGDGSASYTGMSIVRGGNVWNPQKLNFGPQVGFNWLPNEFGGKVVIRGGYGLNYNQQEIAITGNTVYNPGAATALTFQWSNPTNPGTNGNDIVYGISSSPTSLDGYASNPNAITSYNTANLPTSGNGNVVIIGDGHGNVPTTYVQHYSLDTQYQPNPEMVFSLGYQGSVGRHLINHMSPNSWGVARGYALNPLVTSGDYWVNAGSSNNNAMLVSLSHPMLHQFSADVQFMWSKSMDTDGSGPYYEDTYYPLNPGYSYGVSDFNIGKSFKAFALWQPVIWHGSHDWLEKVVGGWSVSGIFNWHSGYPYSPSYNLPYSLYCSNCGYQGVRPSYKGGAGSDHSNKAFINGSNFSGLTDTATTTTATVNGSAGTAVAYSNQYFDVQNFQDAITWSNGTGFPAANVGLPSAPGLVRNSFVGPSYRDVDMSLSKNFGLPSTRWLGENTGLEIRADAFNVFNITNLNPSSVNSNVSDQYFGRDTTAMGARTITFQARFNF